MRKMKNKKKKVFTNQIQLQKIYLLKKAKLILLGMLQKL